MHAIVLRSMANPRHEKFFRIEMDSSSSHKAIVIGAGISGLTTAVYLQRSGIQTLILEKAAGPGGVSTSWKRKGYTFEGGVHWLIGAKEGIPLHQVWLETGALQESHPVHFKDPIYTLVDREGIMPLFRDLHGLELKGLRDRMALWSLRFHLACFRHFHQPINDLRGLRVKYPKPFSVGEYVKMLPAVLVTPFLMAQSARGYAKRFKNNRIRALLAAVVEPNVNALSLIYTLGTFHEGDSGYPKGGSLRLAQNMADSFLGLGGEIRYQTMAEGILPDGKGWAVRTDGEVLQSDVVVVSADARSAIDTLFREPLQDGWAKKMRSGLRTTQCMFLGVGVEADLSSRPRSMQIVLHSPLKAAGRTYETVVVNNYATEDGYAPEGCSVITCLLHGPTYAYWKAAKDDGSYEAKKKEVMDGFLEAMGKVIPEIRDAVVVTNMATPLTYERYCGTFEGSYMTDWPPFSRLYHAPIRYRKGLYFTGQRTAYSGGLPPAAQSGRTTAQTVCKDFGVEFVSH